jgi:hypothetical protein
MTTTTFFGLLGCGLLCLSLAATALRMDRFPVRVRYAVAVIAVVALFVPIGDLSIAAYVRGVTGDLSVPTIALAVLALYSKLTGRPAPAPRELNALLGLLAGAALFLYPFALGWTPFDPYALGYGSIAFLAALLLVTLAAWHMDLKLVVFVVVAGALAYLGGWYESRNLWDYLIDPLVAFYAVVRLGAGAARRHFLRRQS